MKTKVNVEKKSNMKTIFKVLVLLLLVSFQSCSKEEVEETNLVEEKESIEGKKAFAASNNQAEEGTLENKMQWVAYLTARALLQDNPITGNLAEQDFVNVLTGGYTSNVVRLGDLLNSSDGAFRNAFAKEFGYYSNVDACDTDGGKPKGAAIPDDEGDGRSSFSGQDNETASRVGPSFPSSAAEIYINQLINDYNFEIYLPNGYNEVDNVVISTAVTIALINDEAYRHTPGACNVTYINMTAQTQGNIIMLREY
ncbi:hypothetical protein [uncultured Lacinutrix sp.]|uniref:hypothetical protein n=1 Tax=uncultured Lacinutrix sp. TaxID=574032 RepID=UPI002610D3C0|nr:hypothetical protein [uncultured Lacinutrix sp.]